MYHKIENDYIVFVIVEISKFGLISFAQVVANPGQDHLALAVAQAIEEQYGGWVRPPAEQE